MNTRGFIESSSIILREIGEGIKALDAREVEGLVDAIRAADRIFCIGAGRSGILLQSFCMRLNHLGFKAYCIGGIPCPPAGYGDLVIASSGSGSTASVVAISKKARELGAKIAAITSSRQNEIAAIADQVLLIDAPSDLTNDGRRSRQPMRTLFEQTAFLACETIIVILMSRCTVSETEMAGRHANLE
jgi:6-phospho-3-hexuloisomerase